MSCAISDPRRASEVLLDQAFPFHFAVDRSSLVTRFGRSLKKLCPELTVGHAASRHLSLQQPAIGWEQLVSQPQRTCIVQLHQHDLRLRGQTCGWQQELLFLGSPWLTHGSSVDGLGLEPADFAGHDAAVEHLVSQQGLVKQVAYLKRMVRKLSTTIKAHHQQAVAEQALVRELNSAGDLRIRFTPAGCVVQATASRPDYFHPLPVEELIGTDISQHFPWAAQRLKEAEQWFTQRNTAYGFEFCQSSDYGPCHFDARLARGQHGDYLLVATDVTERRVFAERLQHEIQHDPLTGLPNRVHFEQCLQQAIQQSQGCAILLFDVDDFKSLNGRLGHPLGDMVLRSVAERLRRLLRPGDVPARLGGDEFAILAAHVEHAEEVRERAALLLAEVNRPAQVHGQMIHFTMSTGLAIHEPGLDANQLLRNANLAMQKAKENGQSTVAEFSPPMYEEFSRRVTLRQELEQAIRGKQFTPYYQPIVSLRTGETRGLEALARWRHPARGWLAPADFMDMAERTGLIVDVGRQILAQACDELQQLNTACDLNLSLHVNLSPVQLQQERLVEQVAGILRAAGISPDLLTLEITETALFADLSQAEAVLNDLRAIGVHVALDDFGVGYSSLHYLERFPIDVLKLDRSFVSQGDQPCRRASRLLEPIIHLGRALDLKIVAEGIETPQQARVLAAYGCESAQGYYYGRPAPIAEIRQQLEQSELRLTAL